MLCMDVPIMEEYKVKNLPMSGVRCQVLGELQ